jgi:hypothetical protein
MELNKGASRKVDYIIVSECLEYLFINIYLFVLSRITTTPRLALSISYSIYGQEHVTLYTLQFDISANAFVIRVVQSPKCIVW